MRILPTTRLTFMTQTMMHTYAGEAVNWECDELGHLNMRHYMTKVHQARQFFFIHLGLQNSFRADADSTVRVRKFTIRYLKESRPGARLRIETGLLSLGETQAELVHIMRHFDGEISAAITETVDHIYLRTGKSFAWPSRLRAAAKSKMVERPAATLARGLTDEEAAPLAPPKADLIKYGAFQIGAGVFQPSELDVFRSVTPQALLGRVTESVGNFYALWPEIHDGLYSGGSTSGALLELRCHIHSRATAGEALEIYSAVQGANAYTRQASHHLVDPMSGESWASMIASGCLFDLETRRLLKTSEEQIAKLSAMVIAELRA